MRHRKWNRLQADGRGLQSAHERRPGHLPIHLQGMPWGNCTSSNPFPIEANNIASASTSVSITQPSGYNNDAAYDIWFNQTSTTSGQPNGTEIMIWINHQGSIQPFGSQTAMETIDGTTWEVWTGRQSSWNIVSYVRETPVTSVSNLNLLPFFSDAVSRGIQWNLEQHDQRCTHLICR
jgi:Glycosyl hydrolase family 12